MTSRKTFLDQKLWRIVHENSKNFEVGDSARPDKPPESWKEVTYREYNTNIEIELSPPTEMDSDLSDVMETRRSPGIYGLEQKPVSLSELSICIGQAAKITARGENDSDHKRAYPSGGARYPLEVYIAILNGDNIAKGVYHYNVKEHTLEQLRTTNVIDELDFFHKEIRDTVSVAVFITGVIQRSTSKYGERGYRYATIEAGHLMQNICLFAESSDLACHPYGGFIEDEADRYLKIENMSETTLYCGLIGSPTQH